MTKKTNAPRKPKGQRALNEVAKAATLPVTGDPLPVTGDPLPINTVSTRTTAPEPAPSAVLQWEGKAPRWFGKLKLKLKPGDGASLYVIETEDGPLGLFYSLGRMTAAFAGARTLGGSYSLEGSQAMAERHVTTGRVRTKP